MATVIFDDPHNTITIDTPPRRRELAFYLYGQEVARGPANALTGFAECKKLYSDFCHIRNKELVAALERGGKDELQRVIEQQNAKAAYIYEDGSREEVPLETIHKRYSDTIDE